MHEKFEIGYKVWEIVERILHTNRHVSSVDRYTKQWDQTPYRVAVEVCSAANF